MSNIEYYDIHDAAENNKIVGHTIMNDLNYNI